MVIRPGRAPIRSSGGAYRAAIAFLRSLGTSAHVWLPGASGVSVASLPSNNYLLSDFATLAAVNEVVGGVKDGMNPSGGISLTQPTTANKPILRRGMFGELLNSAAPATQSVTCIAAPYTLALYGTGNVVLSGTGAGTLTGTGAADLVVLNFTPAAGSVTFTKAGTVSSFGLFKGTWTAAQLLAEGGIPTTTATAASNPSAGKYWWSLDGSNDYLTAGSVPFQINEDHAVIVGYRNQGSSAADYVFAVKADTYRTACGLTIVSGKPGAYWYDGTLSSEILNATTSYVPVIATAVKRTNAKQLRINGAQSGATDNTALSSFTATYVYVGGSSGPTASTIDASHSFDGSISIVIAVKGTLTDAELLTLERLAASVTPGAPTF